MGVEVSVPMLNQYQSWKLFVCLFVCFTQGVNEMWLGFLFVTNWRASETLTGVTQLKIRDGMFSSVKVLCLYLAEEYHKENV